MAILILKTDASVAASIEVTYNPKMKVNIPKAPGLGLLLAEAHFTGYTKKLEKLQSPCLPIRPSQYEPSLSQFKEQEIYKEITATAYKTNAFYFWLRALRQHAHEFRYLLP